MSLIIAMDALFCYSNSTATTGVQYVNMDRKSEIEGKVNTNTDIPKDAETGSSQIQQQVGE